MVYDFWIESMKLINFLSDLKKNDTYHNDLKPQNILFNTTTRRLNVIDFGMMRNYAAVIAKKWHYSYPPESVFNYTKPEDYNAIAGLSDADFSKIFLGEMDFCCKYHTFLSYTSKTKFVDDRYNFFTSKVFFDNFSKNYIKNTRSRDLKEKYRKTIDIYGAGMALIYVLINTYHLLDFEHKNLFITNIYKLLFSMIHPNCFERIEIEELLPKYKEQIDILKRSRHTVSPPESQIPDFPVKISKEVILENIGTPPVAPKFLKSQKCKDDEELNPLTNRYRKKCKDGEYRNPATKRCNKIKKAVNIPGVASVKSTKDKKTDSKPKSVTLKQCKDDEEINPETNRCRKKCKANQVRNPQTKRCRQI